MAAITGILKKILVPIIAMILTVLLGVGLLLSGLLPFSVSIAGTAADASAGVPTPTPVPYFQPPDGLLEMERGIFYDTGQRIVNLADPGGFRFLRTAIVLEFLPASPEYYNLEGEKRTALEDEFIAQLDRQRPVIDNVITDVLTSRSFDEVFTVEGKSGLREELREQLNKNLRNRHVVRVLITDFVIQ